MHSIQHQAINNQQLIEAQQQQHTDCDQQNQQTTTSTRRTSEIDEVAMNLIEPMHSIEGHELIVGQMLVIDRGGHEILSSVTTNHNHPHHQSFQHHHHSQQHQISTGIEQPEIGDATHRSTTTTTTTSNAVSGTTPPSSTSTTSSSSSSSSLTSSQAPTPAASAIATNTIGANQPQQQQQRLHQLENAPNLHQLQPISSNQIATQLNQLSTVTDPTSTNGDHESHHQVYLLEQAMSSSSSQQNHHHLLTSSHLDEGPRSNNSNQSQTSSTNGRSMSTTNNNDNNSSSNVQQLNNNNSEQAGPINSWLLENYEIADGESLPRSTVYNHYLSYCDKQRWTSVNAASFGKVIRSVFLGLKTRRLGTRGHSKYHYFGIRAKQHVQHELMQRADDSSSGGGGGTSSSHQHQRRAGGGGSSAGNESDCSSNHQYESSQIIIPNKRSRRYNVDHHHQNGNESLDTIGTDGHAGTGNHHQQPNNPTDQHHSNSTCYEPVVPSHQHHQSLHHHPHQHYATSSSIHHHHQAEHNATPSIYDQQQQQPQELYYSQQQHHQINYNTSHHHCHSHQHQSIDAYGQVTAIATSTGNAITMRQPMELYIELCDQPQPHQQQQPHPTTTSSNQQETTTDINSFNHVDLAAPSRHQTPFLRTFLAANSATLVDQHWPMQTNYQHQSDQLWNLFENQYKQHFRRTVEFLSELKFDHIEPMWRQFWQPTTTSSTSSSSSAHETNVQSHADWLTNQSTNRVRSNPEINSATQSSDDNHQNVVSTNVENDQYQQQPPSTTLTYNSLYQLTSQISVSEHIALIDSRLYSAIQAFLIPDILRDVPRQLVGMIANLAKSFVHWMKIWLRTYDVTFQERKLRPAESFCNSLARNAEIISLSMSARQIWNDRSKLDLMSHDLSRVDWQGIELQVNLMDHIHISNNQQIEPHNQQNYQQQHHNQNQQQQFVHANHLQTHHHHHQSHSYQPHLNHNSPDMNNQHPSIHHHQHNHQQSMYPIQHHQQQHLQQQHHQHHSSIGYHHHHQTPHSYLSYNLPNTSENDSTSEKTRSSVGHIVGPTEPETQVTPTTTTPSANDNSVSQANENNNNSNTNDQSAQNGPSSVAGSGGAVIVTSSSSPNLAINSNSQQTNATNTNDNNITQTTNNSTNNANNNNHPNDNHAIVKADRCMPSLNHHPDHHNHHSHSHHAIANTNMHPAQLIQNLLHLLEGPSPGDNWPDWCRNQIESRVTVGHINDEAPDFVLKWNYYMNLIMKDLTIRQRAPSSAMFQLIKVLFDDYFYYLIESMRTNEFIS